MGAVDREDSAGDLVRRSWGDLAVAVHRIGLQSSYEKTATLVTGTAHEHAAPQHRRLVSTNRQARQFRSHDHAIVSLHVPKRERALDDRDAIAVRPFAFAT